jgi:hypothetical protein
MRADWTGLVEETSKKVTDIPADSMLPLQRPEEVVIYDPGDLDRGSPRYQTFWLLTAAGGIFLVFLLFRTNRKGARR